MSSQYLVFPNDVQFSLFREYVGNEFGIAAHRVSVRPGGVVARLEGKHGHPSYRAAASNGHGHYYSLGPVWLFLRNDGRMAVFPQNDIDRWEPWPFELMPDSVRAELSARLDSIPMTRS